MRMVHMGSRRINYFESVIKGIARVNAWARLNFNRSIHLSWYIHFFS